jgi:predicted nuclease with TOPRIM domain
MAKKTGKYKMTWFAKFFIFCLIISGFTYGVTNFTNIPQVLKDNNITSFNDLEEKIDEAIDKKKNKNAEYAEPQIQEDNRLEDRLLQLIEENDKLVEKNEKLKFELEQCKSEKNDMADQGAN